ncbi:hypothetical protein ACF0H5_007661 [Mactra antiquata]
MERSDIVLIIIVSLTSVTLFVLMMFLCAWCSRCCRQKKYIEEEEETLSRSVMSMELGSDGGSSVRQLNKRSWEDNHSNGSADKKSTPIMTRKTIREIYHPVSVIERNIPLELTALLNITVISDGRMSSNFSYVCLLYKVAWRHYLMVIYL